MRALPMIYAPYEEYRIYLLLNLIASWHFLSEDVSQKDCFSTWPISGNTFDKWWYTLLGGQQLWRMEKNLKSKIAFFVSEKKHSERWNFS